MDLKNMYPNSKNPDAERCTSEDFEAARDWLERAEGAFSHDPQEQAEIEDDYHKAYACFSVLNDRFTTDEQVAEALAALAEHRKGS